MWYLIALVATLIPTVTFAAPGERQRLDIFITLDGAARVRLDKLEEGLHFDVVYFADSDDGGMETHVASGEADGDAVTTTSFTMPRGHFDSAWVAVRSLTKGRRLNFVKCSLPTFDPANPPKEVQVDCSLL